jgi:hypothetical protein
MKNLMIVIATLSLLGLSGQSVAESRQELYDQCMTDALEDYEDCMERDQLEDESCHQQLDSDRQMCLQYSNDEGKP